MREVAFSSEADLFFTRSPFQVAQIIVRSGNRDMRSDSVYKRIIEKCKHEVHDPIEHRALFGEVNMTLEEALAADPKSVNSRDHTGWTPLHWATTRNDVAATRLLLAYGADTNAPSSRGQTPLHNATFEDAVGAAQLLIDGGADINARCSMSHTPLHEAVRREAPAVFELLLSRGATTGLSTAGSSVSRWLGYGPRIGSWQTARR